MDGWTGVLRKVFSKALGGETFHKSACHPPSVMAGDSAAKRAINGAKLVLVWRGPAADGIRGWGRGSPGRRIAILGRFGSMGAGPSELPIFASKSSRNYFHSTARHLGPEFPPKFPGI